VVAILLDSSLFVSVSLPSQHQSHPQPSPSNGAYLALLSSPAGVWAFTEGQPFSANMSMRGEIMAYILTNPGVYMREVSGDLGLSMGVVQYHIWVLSKNGEIEECRTGRYRRFFGAAKYSEIERKVISLLRQGTAGKIIMALTDEGPMPHAHLAAVLGLSSRALSWHVRRLRAMGVIEPAPIVDREGRSYRLADGFREEAAAWRS
jgi:predicted ArsR family transcriptional regulator